MTNDLLYIRNNAPPSVPPGQQRLDSFAEMEARNAAENTQTSTNPSQAAPNNVPAPPSPEQFRADIKQMAIDITEKHGQIEKLIATLPGLNSSEKEQVERMEELERELEDLEGERLQAVKEKETLLQLVEEKIMGVGRMRGVS